MYDYDSVEEPLTGGVLGFSEKSIRLGFIRKVYGILLCQLAITLAVMSIIFFEPNCKQYSQTHPEMWIIFMVLTIVLLIVLACCPDVRRKSPTNFILLGIFTVSEAFLLGAVAAFSDTESVVMAVGICAVVSLSLTMFAFQTKWDFTAFGGILFVAVIVLFCFGLLAICIPSKVVNLLYGALGALIFSMYLVFDTQMMIGGHHKYSISPEEYVFAALNLYLDIINLFLYILMILNEIKK